MKYRKMFFAMMLFVPALLGITATALPRPSMAALDVTIEGIENGKPIPDQFVSCTLKGGKGGNISPSISWSQGPEGTKSYALIVVDRDVPTEFDSANKEGETISADQPRRDFYHWVLVDIPPGVTSLPRNAAGDGYGLSGQNDMERKNGGNGYDGPCPPWNDARMHHYHFQVYALDVPSLGLRSFDGKQAEEAIESHVLAKGEVVGTYTTNPAMRP